MDDPNPPSGLIDHTVTVEQAMPSSAGPPSAELAGRSKPSPNLMTIPTELRLLILEELLLSQTCLRHCSAWSHSWPHPPRLPIAVLGCCKQLTAEGLPILYKNTFIWVDYAPWSKRDRSMISHVKIQVHKPGSYGCPASLGISRIYRFYQKLRGLAAIWQLENSKSLTIELVWYNPRPHLRETRLRVEGCPGMVWLLIPPLSDYIQLSKKFLDAEADEIRESVIDFMERRKTQGRIV